MISKKRVLAGILGCLLAIGHPAAAMAVSSEAVPQEQMQEDCELPKSPDDLQPDYDDPDYVKRLMQPDMEEEPASFSLRSVSAKKTKSPFTGLQYTHAVQLSDCDIVNGIDVSKWQAEINWKKVKAAGVKFVFIRCGYTSMSDKFSMNEDEYFKQNIKNAYNAGIEVGVYYFSNSKTVSEAKKEAEKTLDLLEGYEHMITLPVVYDFEAFSNAYRAYGLPKSQITKNALAYFNIIQLAGFTPIYYGSPNVMDVWFDTVKLADYDCWLANYTTQTAYTGDYVYWQYSSKGQVNGISGNVDCNFYYAPSDDSPSDDQEIAVGPSGPLGPVTGLKMTDNTTSSISIAWDPLEDANGYKVYRSKSYGGDYKQVKVISGSSVTSYTDTTVMESEGRQYYYKVVPYIINADSDMQYGMESDILTAYTLRIYSYRLKTQATLNLREQAGTEYASVSIVPAGVGLAFYKYTLSTNDKKWYKVTYSQNGKSYVGYLSGNYVSIYTYGKATKKVNLRSGAGLNYKVQRAVPKGTKLTIVSTKTDKSGIQWSYVKYTKSGKAYKGYIPTKYIKRV